MTPVNVVVSGLPHCGVLCFQLGNTARGVTTAEVERAICSSTGMPDSSIFLRAGTKLLLGPADLVCPADTNTAFLWAGLRRALPGGKGGFGAQLRGRTSKAGGGRTTNIDACRDLNGRRIGAVRRERAAAQAQQIQQQDGPGPGQGHRHNRAIASTEEDGVDDGHDDENRLHRYRHHQQKRCRTTQPAHMSSPVLSPAPTLTAMQITAPDASQVGVAQCARDASNDVSDAVRQGLLCQLENSGPGAQKRIGTAVVVDAGRNCKRRRTEECGALSSLADAYGASSSSSDESERAGRGSREDECMSDD